MNTASVATPERTLDDTRVEGVELDLEKSLGITFSTQNPYAVIVWNDDHNLAEYVASVFSRYFGFSQRKSWDLVYEIHHGGRATVWTGKKSDAKKHVEAMKRYGLRCTLEQVG